jgi:hypothetical protein
LIPFRQRGARTRLETIELEGMAMTRIRRGVAHCRTSGCWENEKLVALVPFALEFTCPRCGRPAAIEAEFGTGLGSSQHYNEVRVYFGFDPATRTYTELAVSQDESLVGQHSAYAFFTPLVRERADAERVASTLLRKLNGERASRLQAAHVTSEQLRREGWRIAS